MNTLTPVLLLTRVREKIADPDRWTKGYAARDAAGHPTQASDPNARCWCLLGAFSRAYTDGLDRGELVGPETITAAQGMLSRAIVADQPCYTTIANFNDTATHNQVLAALDEAIQGAAR